MLNNYDAELLLLGDVLLNPALIAEISGEIVADDFAFFELRAVYVAMLDLFADSKRIDPLTICDRCSDLHGEKSRTLLLKINGMAVSSEAYRTHIELVKKASRLRRTRRAAEKLIEDIDETEDVELCRKSAEDVLKAFDGMETESAVSAKEGFESFLANARRERSYIKFGLNEIDRFVKMSPGDFVVIGGRPSTGKTAMTLQMMLEMSDKYRVAYFSLETSPGKLFERLVANYTIRPFSRIKNGCLNDKEVLEIEAIGGKKFNTSQFWVVPASGWTVDKIKSKALQLQAQVIFVDYLGLIDGVGKSLYERVSEISVSLQRLAHTTEIAVVALAQLNRAGNGAPDMTSLRDSGQIEQDADAIMLLWTPKDDAEHREEKQLIIAKNKEGETGYVDLKFSGEYQRFLSYQRGEEPRRKSSGRQAKSVHGEKDDFIEI